MEKTVHTFESVWAAFAETDRLIKEMREANAIASAETDRKFAEIDRKFAETDRLVKEMRAPNRISSVELDRKFAATARQFKKLGKIIGGVSRRRGLFAEEYFFKSFKRGKKNFFGENFDKILRSETLELEKPAAEIDILLVNEKAVAVIEVKFRVNGKNLDELKNKIKYFRQKFPEYNNHKVYLGIASMVFEDNMEYECIENGIAVIKQVDDKVVICDERLRAYT